MYTLNTYFVSAYTLKLMSVEELTKEKSMSSGKNRVNFLTKKKQSCSLQIVEEIEFC